MQLKDFACVFCLTFSRVLSSVFVGCCFSVVTHLQLWLWAACQVTFRTFHILFVFHTHICIYFIFVFLLLVVFFFLSISRRFARFPVECHERACSSGSLGLLDGFCLWPMAFWLARPAWATYPLSWASSCIVDCLKIANPSLSGTCCLPACLHLVTCLDCSPALAAQLGICIWKSIWANSLVRFHCIWRRGGTIGQSNGSAVVIVWP